MLKIMEKLGKKISVCEAFYGHGRTTIDFDLLEERRQDPEWRDDMTDSQIVEACIVEACCASWRLDETDEVGCSIYVKCMEPAHYRVRTPVEVITRDTYFCKAHKPRVVPL